MNTTQPTGIWKRLLKLVRLKDPENIFTNLWVKLFLVQGPDDQASAANLEKYLDDMKNQNQTVQVENAKPLMMTQFKNATWDKTFLYERLCRGDKDYVSSNRLIPFFTHSITGG